MRVYLDTNVLVAYFKPNDPYYLDSRAILNCSRINKVVSFLTLAEFSSVISRLEKGGQVEFAPEIRAINFQDTSEGKSDYIVEIYC